MMLTEAQADKCIDILKGIWYAANHLRTATLKEGDLENLLDAIESDARETLESLGLEVSNERHAS